MLTSGIQTAVRLDARSALRGSSRLLHWLLLIVLAVSAWSGPGMVLSSQAESEAPIEEADGAQEVTLSEELAIEACRRGRPLPWNPEARYGARLSRIGVTPAAPLFGHRLSNGLSAPLLC